MNSGQRTGKLFLIGAGPGDPELLTLKAVRALGESDVVLYDRLVSRETLRHAKADAELIYVGKHRGEQEHKQGEIFDLIRTHALAGKTVARLKGGDPMVFGRGAEEWAQALEAGIEVELIPGVSSAIAVPGMAGIPLTFRRNSQSFAIITGHCHQGVTPEWTRYALVDTLVILMGVKNRVAIAAGLIAAGRSRMEPAVFVERGTTSGQRVVETTLGDIATGSVEVHSPAVFVVGDVVRLRQRLAPTSPRR
ncbi:MAG: uroporphyrinogen-III C-methyltransferase [Acidobacteriaceae bacterium]|nr:uroporphyrinogen-III C-methyltransferase [Acidobacteriaceae bacterium]